MIIEKDELATAALTQVIYSMNQQAYALGSPWSVEQITSAIENKYNQYLLLQEQGEWLGYLSYQGILDEIEITQLVVLPKYQQQGFGRQLMQTLLDQAQEQHIKRIFLEVRASNERARTLYEHLGFTRVSVRKNYYHQPTEDGHVMSVTIEEVSK